MLESFIGMLGVYGLIIGSAQVRHFLKGGRTLH